MSKPIIMDPSPSHTMQSKLCQICRKKPVRNVLFCDNCLSHEEREKNLDRRIRVILKLQKRRIGFLHGSFTYNPKEK